MLRDLIALRGSVVKRTNPSAAAVILLACGLAVLLGCDKRVANRPNSDPPSSTARQTAPVSAAPTPPPMGDADLLQGVPVGAAATNKELAAAEQAWVNLLTDMKPPQAPAEWETNPPSKEVQAEFRKKTGESAAKTAARAQEFYTRFPTHEHAAEAKEREHYLLNAALQLGYTNAQARLEALEASRLTDPNLSEDERLQLRVQQIQRTAFKLGGEDSKVVLTELEKGARAIQKEFPRRPEVAGLFVALAEGWLERGDPTKARSLAAEVTALTTDEELKSTADALLKKLDRIGKPVDIKFSAIDGRSVDLQGMKGKVVLVDFWATWCAPCMQELPNVKAVYEKLHPRGFEIVGISLDRTKEALEEVVKKEKLPWPQFYDDSGEVNRFAEQFEVTSIPAMWLIDKKGTLRDLNARDDLTAKVEKLLAE
jgi:thiol-disulfide isomerase/thioredoxin